MEEGWWSMSLSHRIDCLLEKHLKLSQRKCGSIVLKTFVFWCKPPANTCLPASFNLLIQPALPMQCITSNPASKCLLVNVPDSINLGFFFFQVSRVSSSNFAYCWLCATTALRARTLTDLDSWPWLWLLLSGLTKSYGLSSVAMNIVYVILDTWCPWLHSKHCSCTGESPLQQLPRHVVRHYLFVFSLPSKMPISQLHNLDTNK